MTSRFTHPMVPWRVRQASNRCAWSKARTTSIDSPWPMQRYLVCSCRPVPAQRLAARRKAESVLNCKNLVKKCRAALYPLVHSPPVFAVSSTSRKDLSMKRVIFLALIRVFPFREWARQGPIEGSIRSIDYTKALDFVKLAANKKTGFPRLSS